MVCSLTRDYTCWVTPTIIIQPIAKVNRLKIGAEMVQTDRKPPILCRVIRCWNAQSCKYMMNAAWLIIFSRLNKANKLYIKLARCFNVRSMRPCSSKRTMDVCCFSVHCQHDMRFFPLPLSKCRPTIAAQSAWKQKGRWIDKLCDSYFYWNMM